jgi:hypothetical protein
MRIWLVIRKLPLFDLALSFAECICKRSAGDGSQITFVLQLFQCVIESAVAWRARRSPRYGGGDDADRAGCRHTRTRAEDPKATRKNVMRHNIIGGPGCTVMPDLLDAKDFIVNTKKRYDCFLGTDLDFLLRSHGINTLLITGVNTNSCVLATTTAANVRDYGDRGRRLRRQHGQPRTPCRRACLHQNCLRLRDECRCGDGARRTRASPEQCRMTAPILHRPKSAIR